MCKLDSQFIAKLEMAMRWSGESPPNGRGHDPCPLGKRTRGMLGPRVVGEGKGWGKGESITAKAMTSRYTNVTETNQHPAFVVLHTVEVRMYPHVERCVCTPTEQIARTHMTACMCKENKMLEHPGPNRQACMLSSVYLPISLKNGQLC